MDYTRTTVFTLLRGPLMFTPQGWVVLATSAACWSWAAYLWLSGSSIIGAHEAERELVLLLAWPLLVFLFYVRLCMPHFRASWTQTAYLAVTAVSLPAFVLIQ